MPAGSRVRLSFTFFSVETDWCVWGTRLCHCHLDWVEVSYEGFRERYCGYSPPCSITSNNNTITLSLHTDGMFNYQGFNATYWPV